MEKGTTRTQATSWKLWNPRHVHMWTVPQNWSAEILPQQEVGSDLHVEMANYRQSHRRHHKASSASFTRRGGRNLWNLELFPYMVEEIAVWTRSPECDHQVCELFALKFAGLSTVKWKTHCSQVFRVRVLINCYLHTLQRHCTKREGKRSDRNRVQNEQKARKTK